MVKKNDKRKLDIRAKLVAAICMLLVSSIMVVSSTYAWFTLSTAPEVTGISTAVGANGNLEMALLPTDGKLTSIGDAFGLTDVLQSNTTWGNLVDLSHSDYGLNQIMLSPAALNMNGDKLNTATPLQFPEYGSDGRVSALNREDAMTAIYKDNGFIPADEYGVRAVGTASGMSDRQLAYRNALVAANTAMSQAKTEAAKSLTTNGATLANVAMKKATNDAAKFGKADVASLMAIVNDLTGKVLPQIERAYMQYILAFAASAQVTNEEAWEGVKAIIEGSEASMANLQAKFEEYNITFPAELATPIAAYNKTLEQVNSAKGDLTTMQEEIAAQEKANETAEAPVDVQAMFDWARISTPLYKLAKTDDMKLNGQPISGLKENMNAIINDVLVNGLTVSMASGGGVYADIADHCGDYSASITIAKVEYGGMALNNMNARMQTKTDVNPTYLSLIDAAAKAAGAPKNENNTAAPLTDMFGYIIDLGFRTNAANSNLLLQQLGTDRIYGDNSNEETMGHGSSMTFQATTTDFSDDQVKNLMECIRIVFFDPTSGEIYAYAKLDVAKATIGADGVTAYMYIYEYTYGEGVLEDGYYGTEVSATEGNVTTITTTYKNATGDTVGVMKEVVTTEGETTTSVVTYYAADGIAESDKATVEAARVAAPKNVEVAVEDNVITSLNQNEAKAISTLVYLDGETITNADVAANAASSMTGKMNLQFASSAELKPMEYGDLHTPGATTPPTSSVPGTEENN